MFAALSNEMGRIGQPYAEPDTADAQAVKARVGQHSMRGGHSALIQDPAEGHARAVQAAVQGSLGDVEMRGDVRGGQAGFAVALPDYVMDSFAQRVVMPFGTRAGSFLSQR